MDVNLRKMANNVFCEKLKNSFVIFDGGMGTQLQENGLAAGEAPEVFLLKNPEKVKKIHTLYKEAGADALTSCTFGANRLKMANTPYTTEQVIKCALETAKKAAGDSIFVGLDIGPIGEMVEPIGTLKKDEAYDIFKEQAVLGEKYGADFIIIETMTDLTEAKLAVLAAKENTSLPVVCTMSFEEGGRTFTGCLASAMALTLSNLADAVGINCSLGPAEILPIAKTLLKYTDLPVVIQPNAGLPKSVGDRAVYDVLPDDFAAAMKNLHILG